LETVITISDGRCFVSSDDASIIRHWKKDSERWPGEFRKIADPESNDGCMYWEVPRWWGQRAARNLVPHAKREMTEGQKEALAARLSAAREKKGGVKHGDV